MSFLRISLCLEPNHSRTWCAFHACPQARTCCLQKERDYVGVISVWSSSDFLSLLIPPRSVSCFQRSADCRFASIRLLILAISSIASPTRHGCFCHFALGCLYFQDGLPPAIFWLRRSRLAMGPVLCVPPHRLVGSEAKSRRSSVAIGSLCLSQ